MQIKNNKNLIISFILCLFFYQISVHAEEFNISAKEITLDKNNVVTGEGAVRVTDIEGKIIKADKVIFETSSLARARI